MTPFRLHVEEWKDCQACSLCATRSSVVLARGQVPCDVLFVGEAPGRSEDALGKPFCGPAGHLLNSIVEHALDDVRLCIDCGDALRDGGGGLECPRCGAGGVGRKVRVAFTNLIACLPLDDDGDKVSDPPDEAVAACADRLVQFVDLCKPGLLVRVGSHAKHWLTRGHRESIRLRWDCRHVDMLHPAYILRQSVAMQDHLARRQIVVLKAAAEALQVPQAATTNVPHHPNGDIPF